MPRPAHPSSPFLPPSSKETVYPPAMILANLFSFVKLFFGIFLVARKKVHAPTAFLRFFSKYFLSLENFSS
jgi:hypothetical protein